MKKFTSFKTTSIITSALIFISFFQTASAIDFIDLDSNTNFKDSILWMERNGVINGYPDQTFKPDKCVNRAEFLKMLFKILAIDTANSKAELFPDTPKAAWYAEYVRTGKERGIIKGYNDGKFRPDQCVSRAEAIKMALLEFKFADFDAYKTGDEAKKAIEAKYPKMPKELDITFENKIKNSLKLLNYQPSDWYNKFAIYALEGNLLGLENKTFDPGKAMPRKEVAEMLYRMKTVKDREIIGYETGYKPDPLILKKAEVNFEIEEILLTSSHDTETGDLLEFDLYLERPELGLKQNIKYLNPMPLTVDLALALQPRFMYISRVDDKKPDSGAMCDRPRFPHRCSVTIKGKELEKTETTLLVKITFEDDSYVAKEISVPHPDGLAKPEIVMPEAKPAQKSLFNIKFKDVGADKYDVSVNLCEEYKDDGINPCLDGTEYHLTRDKDANDFIVTYAGIAETDNKISPKIEISEGFITLSSNFELNYSESMTYNVIASSTGKTITGIPISLSSQNSKTYQREIE